MILRKKSGQSLIEILVAIGVGVIMLVGAVTALTPAIKSLSDVSRTQGSAAVSKELLDNLRIFAEENWHNIDTLSTSTKYFLNTATSTFLVATGTEAVVADGITSGLVGYWKLDETATSSAMDFSGYGNNGTTYGTTAVDGRIGMARSFNGSSDYIDLGNNSILSSDVQTISFWLINKGTNKTAYILDRSSNSDIWGYHALVYVGGNLMVSENSSGGEHQIVTSYDNLNNGSLLTFVYDWPKVYFYINGSLNNTLTFTNHFNTGSSYKTSIGRAGEYSNYYFDGSLDDVRLYNRALSSTEVNTIYRANIFTRNFQVSDVYRDTADSDKIITGTAGSLDPSTKQITIEYGWPGSQLKTFSAYFTRYKNRSFVQTSWQGGVGSAYTSTTANWFTTSSNVNYSTSTGIRILGL